MKTSRCNLSPKQLLNQDLWRLKGIKASLLSLPLNGMWSEIGIFIHKCETQLRNLHDNTNHYDRRSK